MPNTISVPVQWWISIESNERRGPAQCIRCANEIITNVIVQSNTVDCYVTTLTDAFDRVYCVLSAESARDYKELLCLDVSPASVSRATDLLLQQVYLHIPMRWLFAVSTRQL